MMETTATVYDLLLYARCGLIKFKHNLFTSITQKAHGTDKRVLEGADGVYGLTITKTST